MQKVFLRNDLYLKLIVYSILLFLVNSFFTNFFEIDKLFYFSLLQKATSKQVEVFFGYKEKWNWLIYVLVPISLIVKTIVIAVVLYIGTSFFSKTTTTIKQLCIIVIDAEFVFLLVPVFKIIWFYFFQTNYKLEDLQYFYPLSALNIVGYKGLESWFIYPFQTLNLFELAYWLILANYIGKATKTNMDNGLKIVACSYGPALLLWVVTIMFFTLNFS